MLSPHLKPQSHQLRLFSSILLLLVPSLLILARWKGPNLKRVEPASLPQIGRSDNKVEAELVTITPTGFEPAEITRPAGRFLLAIDNRSGLEEPALYLERETGTRLNTSIGKKGRLAWREAIDFPPGTYILRALNDESWRCRITITAR